MTRYRVRADVATCRTADPAGIGRGGFTTVTLLRGALLPVDVSAAQVEHLLSVRVIEPVQQAL